MRLNEIQINEIVRIFEKDIPDEILLRPYTMGLVPGAVVSCSGKTGNNIELNLYGNRFVISNDLAKKYSCMKLS